MCLCLFSPFFYLVEKKKRINFSSLSHRSSKWMKLDRSIITHRSFMACFLFGDSRPFFSLYFFLSFLSFVSCFFLVLLRRYYYFQSSITLHRIVLFIYRFFVHYFPLCLPVFLSVDCIFLIVFTYDIRIHRPDNSFACSSSVSSLRTFK